jgi:hypothetical protein
LQKVWDVVKKSLTTEERNISFYYPQTFKERKYCLADGSICGQSRFKLLGLGKVDVTTEVNKNMMLIATYSDRNAVWQRAVFCGKPELFRKNRIWLC